MAHRKHIFVSLVLLAISGILFGCGDSTVAPEPITEAPIVAPSNVTAQELPNGDVMIQWDASTQPNLRGYNVYRLDMSNDRIGRLNTTELSQTSFLDQSAAGTAEYEYRVTSVSDRGTESGYSSVVIVLVDESAPGTHDRRVKND